ncbi:MAG: hypothetical protein GX069_01775 [Tissierellia bacterium]|nr:hypothetical protein [Tissierellia bacterium]
MKLKDIAHIRTGDKGNLINIAVIAYDEENYHTLKENITAEVVEDFFSEFCKGEVIRYEIDTLNALNFVLHNFLDGGVTRNLRLDRHGKSMGMALGEMEINISK